MLEAISVDLPKNPGKVVTISNLLGAALPIAIAKAIGKSNFGIKLIITETMLQAEQLQSVIVNFLDDKNTEILPFPDWETLSYDSFSPHKEISSIRLKTLHKLSFIENAIIIAPVATLMQRICPKEFLWQQVFDIKINDKLNLQKLQQILIDSGYNNVKEVIQPGEFSIRGALVDIYPMGSDLPFRLDLFDNEVDSIRSFDPQTQRTIDKLDTISLLPGKEFPTNSEAIELFRTNWRSIFTGDPRNATFYRDVSQGIFPGGIEYYLPLFFKDTATLFSYLPEDSYIFKVGDLFKAACEHYEQTNKRFQQLSHDITKPILAPKLMMLMVEEVMHAIKQKFVLEFLLTSSRNPIDVQPSVQSLKQLQQFINNNLDFKVIIFVESKGREALVLEQLEELDIANKVEIRIGQLISGVISNVDKIAIIAEADFLHKVKQQRYSRTTHKDWDTAVSNLEELTLGTPVVHVDHGIGRYAGLINLDINGAMGEFLLLEYKNAAKLYVPVANLHLISRYSGTNAENLQLHSLGNDKWQKEKQKTAKKIKDTAAELLELYAKRAHKTGLACEFNKQLYNEFAASFDFEETADQTRAISEVINDLISPQPMDRVVCGDVGFGKTEVALRAAFIAITSGKQVAILVPTTLLAQQHFDTFQNRMSQFSIIVESVSRLVSTSKQKNVLELLQQGKVDLIIGTHKLLQKDVKFKNLGLLIIDEEHRFGVKQKEKIKALKAEVDILTLTATPIPRTLNMGLSGMRDLSIIATPPEKRLAVKTFVHKYNDTIVLDAIMREINRGGQVYYLHNNVATIGACFDRLKQLVPNAEVAIAHGQMPERELELVMRDFYHRKFHILLCTTIIETGIDVPTANTIIIERADKLGLAQLHQLRGRVGRSHHQAYAFCLTIDLELITNDAKMRLEAITKADSLGAGFALANHDLEIRGAGELLGEEQSGNITTIGFTLYMELLDRAVKALQQGNLSLDEEELYLGELTEVDLQLPALIPNSYLPDVAMRLIFYKKIANCNNKIELNDVKAEMIDRFGNLPKAVTVLLQQTELKMLCNSLGIIKLKASDYGGKITFGKAPKVSTEKIVNLVQNQPQSYKIFDATNLGFYKKLDDPENKVNFIKELLNNLK